MSEATSSDFDPEVRRQVLGMSEIGALLGLSPYQSPADLALEKLGRVDRFEGVEEGPKGKGSPLYWGKKLERSIAEGFQDLMTEHRGEPVKVRKDGRRYSKADLRTVCHLDYRIQGEGSAVECKRPGNLFIGDWGDEWTDAIPEHYLVQCHGQLWHNENLERVYVPRLVGHELFVYVVDRDERWFSLFENRVSEFWAYVDAGQVPDLDFHRRNVKSTIEAMYPDVDADQVLQWGETELALTTSIKAMAERRLECAKAEDAMKNELRFRMGSAAFALLPDGTCWRRQVQKRAGYTVEPSEQIDFRHMKKPPKGVE